MLQNVLFVKEAQKVTTYNLDDLEKHLIELKEFNVGFLSVDDENFGSNKIHL